MNSENKSAPVFSKKIMYAALALFCFYFAAYPMFRYLIPLIEDIVVDRTLILSGQAIKSEWCISLDGVYDVYLRFPVTPGKDFDVILGRGSYSTSGEYRITQKGVDIPLTFTISQGGVQYMLDVSNVYPTTARTSKEGFDRRIGRLRIIRGCYQSVTSLGEMPENLKGLTATLLVSIYEPIGGVGKAAAWFFGYSDWWTAVMYRAHLRPVLWAGFVFFTIALFYRRRPS